MIASVQSELRALRTLARAMGVHTRYIDGLGRRVTVGAETLVRVCAALGAPVERPADAADALRARRALRGGHGAVGLPPVLVAWDGVLPAVPHPHGGAVEAELKADDGVVHRLEGAHGALRLPAALAPGYYRLRLQTSTLS